MAAPPATSGKELVLNPKFRQISEPGKFDDRTGCSLSVIVKHKGHSHVDVSHSIDGGKEEACCRHVYVFCVTLRSK